MNDCAGRHCPAARELARQTTKEGADRMDVIFAYLADPSTLISPCVLPVLPLVLASSLHRD
jgi:cytochrome c biogenesis protein CcdA